MGLLLSGLALWQGFGYLIGGRDFTISRGWMPLDRLLYWCGGLHAHGAIMAALGLALALQLRGPYDRAMLWTLRLFRTYCLVVACTWLGSWTLYGISWAPPAWWVLLALIATWMTWYAPTGTRSA